MTTPRPNDPDRRRVIRAGLAFATAAVLPLPAFALTEANARVLIDKVVADINRVIASGKPLEAMIRDFQRIFRSYADVSIIAQSTLGPDARRASPAQMRAFTTAFEGYISRKYGKRFHEFIGGRIEVQGVKTVKSWQEVITTVFLRGEAPFEVRFLVSDRSGRDLFFDMVIEGVSLRLSERTEVGAMLDARRGDIDALIADLSAAG